MARPKWITYFDALPDPRVERTRRHELSDILVMMLIASICDCRGWDSTYEMFRHGPAELRGLLALPNGVPSADTLRRVMGALDPKAFGKAFMAWARALCQSTDGKLVAIDGKTIRGAFADGSAGSLHIVNAWVAENSMVLGHYATDVKSNEITAIPELLKLLDIQGAVISIDAMGCQKEIAKAICGRGADYIFGLKGNHPTLHQEVLETFDDDTCAMLAKSAETFHEHADKGHGRVELRKVWVHKNVQWLHQSEQWQGLKTMVMIESERTVKGNTSRERRVYISSLEISAKRMLSLVRSHWHIENKLHWVLDVTFGEDRARIAKKNGAENLGIVRKIALNMLQNAPKPMGRKSIAATKQLATWRFDYLLTVLGSGMFED